MSDLDCCMGYRSTTAFLGNVLNQSRVYSWNKIFNRKFKWFWNPGYCEYWREAKCYCIYFWAVFWERVCMSRQRCLREMWPFQFVFILSSQIHTVAVQCLSTLHVVKLVLWREEFSFNPEIFPFWSWPWKREKHREENCKKERKKYV